ncbi:hypothetical protein [Undibacterium sp. Ren11W]|uniref:hypothetical protein n=1 Tax=Undibacterium sp. Ren11W TaxID=3413045 RepID=UPI003BF00D0F
MQKKNKFLALIFIIFSSMSLTSNVVLAGEGDTQSVNVNQVIEFEQYPVEIISTTSRKKRSSLQNCAKQYKTVITNAMQEPVNFAGHYRVVTLGCGTDCRGFAVVDKVSGVTYTLPGVEFVAGVMGNEEARIQFKTDSRLFIITGSKNDENEGKFHYLWSGKELKLLATFPIKKQDYSE